MTAGGGKHPPPPSAAPGGKSPVLLGLSTVISFVYKDKWWGLILKNVSYLLFGKYLKKHSFIPSPHQSPFTTLWQSCSNPHLKIRPIAIFVFYSLNYSLAARLQDNSRPKSPTKVETKRKLQQFTVSGWLTINGGASDSEKRKL